MTESDHFVEAIASARWLIFKFLAQKKANILLAVFFACFWHFKFLFTKNDHFTNALTIFEY